MAINYQFDDISFLSLRKDLEGYSWRSFCQDAMAGLTVALVSLPQAMAYALLIGLPLSCSLLASIFSTALACMFGSSRHLINGQSNAIAILIQTGTAEVLFTYFRDSPPGERELISLQILTQLTLMVGVMQILAAVCRLGRLTQFVSHSVVIGYVVGATLAVIINQVFIFFGIPQPDTAGSLYERAVYFFTHFYEMHWPTTLIGVGSLVLFLVMRAVDPRIPAAVITLVVSAMLVQMVDGLAYNGLLFFPSQYLSEYGRNIMVVGDLGELDAFTSIFAWPSFNTGVMNQLLPIAFAVALLSILETTSIAKSIAAASGQRLSINQEVFGLGLGNFFSSLISAVPIAGSASRSVANYAGGGQTRFAGILSCVYIALMTMFLGFLVYSIPLAALAAFLLATALNIINTQQLCLCLKATSSDAFVLWTTILACLFFSFDIAFYIGVGLSITLYLKKASIPQLVEYEIDDSGELMNIDFSKPQADHKMIRVIKVEGELFFGAADLFQTTLKTIAEDDTHTKVIVLQLKNARDIDATACLALQRLYEYMYTSGRHLIACGMTLQVWEVLSDSGLVELIGKENLFIFDERHPQLFMQKALFRAKELVSQPVEQNIAAKDFFVPVVEPVPVSETN